MTCIFRRLALLNITLALFDTGCAAAVDAIFFVTVASADDPIALGDCHIVFWTFGDYMDPCRSGCSADGGARVGLNSFDTGFRSGRDNLTYLLTLQCLHAKVSTDSCTAVNYPWFRPHGSLVFFKPEEAPVNLGRFTVARLRMLPPIARAPRKHAWWQALAWLDHPLMCNTPSKTKWLHVTAYIGWLVFIALIWLLKTSWSHSALSSARTALSAYAADGDGGLHCKHTSMFPI